MAPDFTIVRAGELPALLQLLVLDARIRQAEGTSLDIVRQLNEHRLGIQSVTRFGNKERAQLAGMARDDRDRARIERLVRDREQQVVRLAEILDQDLRRSEPALERMREAIRVSRNEREAILRKLDCALVARYEELLERGVHTFIVFVGDGSCGGCGLRLPSSLMDVVRRPDTIASCPRCDRMLYGRGLDA
jgi:predicted  nucleic acid-binding Zn-ribbon protein